MQKAKKMSKQTLVIAVLAVMLVLSLALSVTGAWFTDTANADISADINFGTVAIAIDDENPDGTWTKTSTTTALVIPGSEYTVGGSVTSSSDVDIYVYITVGEIDFQKADGTSIKADIATHLEAITTVVAGFAEVNGTDQPGMYKITANNATALTYTTGVKIKTSLPNEVGDNVFNGADAGAYKLVASVKVAAIQADNIDAATAYTELQALAA